MKFTVPIQFAGTVEVEVPDRLNFEDQLRLAKLVTELHLPAGYDHNEIVHPMAAVVKKKEGGGASFVRTTLIEFFKSITRLPSKQITEEEKEVFDNYQESFKDYQEEWGGEATIEEWNDLKLDVVGVWSGSALPLGLPMHDSFHAHTSDSPDRFGVSRLIIGQVDQTIRISRPDLTPESLIAGINNGSVQIPLEAKGSVMFHMPARQFDDDGTMLDMSELKSVGYVEEIHFDCKLGQSELFLAGKSLQDEKDDVQPPNLTKEAEDHLRSQIRHTIEEYTEKSQLLNAVERERLVNEIINENFGFHDDDDDDDDDEGETGWDDEELL